MQAVTVGEQLHLQHGPIDLLISVDAPIRARLRAFETAALAFDGLLDELVTELALLQSPLEAWSTVTVPPASGPTAKGPVAKRMMKAANALRRHAHLTPMVAVAGAVADEIGAAIASSQRADSPVLFPAPNTGGSGQLRRWMVNNGGDISLWLAPGQQFRVGLVPNLETPLASQTIAEQAITIYPEMQIGGIATSGWRGRSFSLGIADSVTVLATSAASADAAATLIANAVNLEGHPGIRREHATDLDSNSDLGTMLVTTGVGQLTQGEIATALRFGADFAEKLCEEGTIIGAALHLSGTVVSTVASTHSTGALADGIRNSLRS